MVFVLWGRKRARGKASGASPTVLRILDHFSPFPGASLVAQWWGNPPANAGDTGSISESGRSPGEGNGNSLQYSCLENPMDRRAWHAAVHGVEKSQTLFSHFTTITPILGQKTTRTRCINAQEHVRQGATEISASVGMAPPFHPSRVWGAISWRLNSLRKRPWVRFCQAGFVQRLWNSSWARQDVAFGLWVSRAFQTPPRMRHEGGQSWEGRGRTLSQSFWVWPCWLTQAVRPSHTWKKRKKILRFHF